MCEKALYSTDMIRYLSKFITPMECLNLSYVDKYMNKYSYFVQAFENSLLSVIQRVCKVDSKNAKDLVSATKKHGGYFSGSAILQALFCEEYDSDVDIYFPYTMVNNNSLSEIVKSPVRLKYLDDDLYIEKTGGELDIRCPAYFVSNGELILVYNSASETYRYLYGPFPYDRLQILMVEKSKFSKGNGILSDLIGDIKKRRSSYFRHTGDDKKSKTIGEYDEFKKMINGCMEMMRDVPEYSVKSAIKNNFDMSIVKNTYGKEGLEVYKMSDLMRRRGTVNTAKLSDDSRLEKYIGRGFTLMFPEGETDIKEPDYERTDRK